MGLQTLRRFGGTTRRRRGPLGRLGHHWGSQVFEKSLSCDNNLRLQSGRDVVKDLSIFAVDLQDGGNWDWTQGEPPKTNPAYDLRFCKSFSRMGGRMHYLQGDNLAFVHNLCQGLMKK